MDDNKTKVRSDLPSGLVTFVFTDIEASTRIVKLLNIEKARQAFDLHNELLRAVWKKYGGVEVNTEGDSFFVAFNSTDRAVAACVEAQQKIAAQTWPGELPVRVRMGIHSGLAAPHLDNYVSLAVHQAARVEAAGHGGQILATEETLADVSVPVGARVVPIGAYRLRDFDEPVRLLRIDPAGVAPMTTAIRATPASRHNLVAHTTSFVGRESDFAIVNSLIGAGTVVSLVGPGGVGKTRLATEVGIHISDSYSDGVWLVELAEVNDEEVFVEALAQAVGASRASSGDRWKDVLDHLAGSSALLVLDNLEHVVDVVAPLLADLIARCPRVAALATSRQPLDLRIEQVYRVQPLTSQNDGSSDVAAAVQLFLDRASAADATFQARDDAQSKIAAVCDRVEGLPLAIEIAAARVRTMSLDDLHESLTDQLHVLRSRDRSLPDRHRTMHALLTWSYELLTQNEQQALRRLAAFASDFHLSAAQAMLSNDGNNDAVDMLWGLVDKSLVTIDLSESSTRYRLPESVQQFALEHLRNDGELAHAVQTAADWFLRSLGPEQPNDRRWLAEMAIELTNLRGLVDMLIDVDQNAAQRIMCSVGSYHDQIGSYSTGVDELHRSARELIEPTAARVGLLTTLADLYLRRGDVDEAVVHLEQAAALEPSTGAPSWDETAVARTRGEIALRRGQGEQAVQIATDALGHATTKIGTARILNLQGLAFSWIGDSAAATAAFTAELELWADMGLVAKVTASHANLAEIAWRRDDWVAAATHQQACLDLALLHGIHMQAAFSFLMAARFSEAEHEWADVVVLNDSATRIIEAAGAQMYADDRHAAEAAHGRACDALGAEQVASLVTPENRPSTLDTAALAMAVFGRITQSADIVG